MGNRGSISPPPTRKRRRINNPDSSAYLENQISVYSWNINGIQPFIQKPITSFFKPEQIPASAPSTPTACLRSFLRRHNWPTILFLQEVKINPNDSATQAAVQRSVRKPPTSAAAAAADDDDEPDYTATFCLPSDAHNARGFGRKIYGVCTIMRRDFATAHAARVRTVAWDLEGRVQVVETSPSPSLSPTPTQPTPKLSIWNVYAVNATAAAYRSPSTGAATGTRHDRKRAFHALLAGECARLERDEGYGVILAGDMNVAPGPLDGFPALRTRPEEHVGHREDFNRKFLAGGGEGGGFDGVDCFRLVHGGRKAYTYYPRGRAWGESCDRVDLIICSSALRDCVVETDILESIAERGPSDHVPLFAKFSFAATSKRSRVHGQEE
ncbi:hypothetical protein MBLNU459_g4588t1 [Dothideomycetes sp. NU459]